VRLLVGDATGAQSALGRAVELGGTDDLPRDLHEALDHLEKDSVVREALGEHIYERYLDAKREEWQEYIGQVSEWELNRYLVQY